jgi:cysteinyl-tRNA synthetase
MSGKIHDVASLLRTSASATLFFLALAAVSCGSSGDGASGHAASNSGGGGANGGSSASGGAGNEGGSGRASGGGGQASGGATSGRGFPVGSPWVSFYGDAKGVDLDLVASTFRIVNIDADPDTGNFTDAELVKMQGGGKNKVISYLDIGSCENFRTYYKKAPAGHASCVSSGALTSEYDGYPDEMWADLSNAAYQDLIVNYVAARLAARNVDGFFLDNLEVVEHGTKTKNGPCNAACSQGGLDLIWELRQKFPSKLIVMQNSTSAVTMKGKTHGVDYPSLLDGVSHEEVYSNGGDAQARREMLAWEGLNLTVAGQKFWLGVEDYAGACSAAKKPTAETYYAKAKSDGFNEYATDDSGKQLTPCYWSTL